MLENLWIALQTIFVFIHMYMHIYAYLYIMCFFVIFIKFIILVLYSSWSLYNFATWIFSLNTMFVSYPCYKQISLPCVLICRTVCYILFTHSSRCGTHSLFPIFAIINNATINMFLGLCKTYQYPNILVHRICTFFTFQFESNKSPKCMNLYSTSTV